jgi:tRNA dimethylallyltransferase
VILGPTASGKTTAAIGLAEQLGTEIISADSRQFYREMIIGTARPSDRELSRVKHHFIGNLSIEQYYNVSMFEKDALQALDQIFTHTQYAIMVGGSGLYIDAVCKGIDELPDPDPQLRAALKTDYLEKGLEHIQSRLQKLDPDYYNMVDLRNPNRILRALEVCLMTGTPYSSFRTMKPVKRDFQIRKYGLDIARNELNRRIDERVDEMMDRGLLEEARSLFPRHDLNALNTVGYKELFDFLDGRCTLEEAVEKIKTNTRRYAKRQMTWFKRDTDIIWLKSWDELPFS